MVIFSVFFKKKKIYINKSLTSRVTLTMCNQQGLELTESRRKRDAASQLVNALTFAISPPSSCMFCQSFLFKFYCFVNTYLYIIFAFSTTAPEFFPSHHIHVHQLNFSPDGLGSYFQVQHHSFPKSTCNCSPVSFLWSTITPKGFTV